MDNIELLGKSVSDLNSGSHGIAEKNTRLSIWDAVSKIKENS